MGGKLSDGEPVGGKPLNSNPPLRLLFFEMRASRFLLTFWLLDGKLSDGEPAGGNPLTSKPPLRFAFLVLVCFSLDSMCL